MIVGSYTFRTPEKVRATHTLTESPVSNFGQTENGVRTRKARRQAGLRRLEKGPAKTEKVRGPVPFPPPCIHGKQFLRRDDR